MLYIFDEVLTLYIILCLCVLSVYLPIDILNILNLKKSAVHVIRE